MMHMTIECSEYRYEIEIPETITVNSKGCVTVVELKRFPEESWTYWLDYAKRCIYDGAPTVGEDRDAVQLDKRQDAMDRKAAMLHGERPIGTKTGDPVASAMKPLALTVLAAMGTKRKDVPKLGTTVAEVRETLKALGVKKPKIDKIEAIAEDNVAAARKAIEALTA